MDGIKEAQSSFLPGTKVGGGQEEKLSPQKRAERLWSGCAKLGSNFFECPTIVPEELIPKQKHVFQMNKMIVDCMML
jgi:hypothetical protein